MNKPKRHHFLPQFYLEYFCRDDHLWVFDRELKEFRRQTPINTALKKHYYSFEDDDGTKYTEIEGKLSQIEGRSKQIIEKIMSKGSITQEEKDVLSIFIALMKYRVPEFEKASNDFEKNLIRQVGDIIYSDEDHAQSVMNHMERDTGELINVSAKQLVEFHKRGEYDIEIHRNASLESMLPLSIKIAEIFRQLDWEILYAPRNTVFITTDNPVALLPPVGYTPNYEGFGIITPGSRKIFPLSQSACLVMYDFGNHLNHRNAPKHDIREINLILARNSDRFIIGRDEVLVRNIVRTTKLVK